MFDVCVTIVNTKERAEIEKSLDSLFADSMESGLNFGIAVIDNSSGEAVEELEKKYTNLRVLRQERNMGFGYSHNRAFEAVTAKYYFILNPDTEFPAGQNFLRRLVKFMDENPKIGMAGPKIFYPDGSLQYSCYRFPSFFQPVFSRTSAGQTETGKKATGRYLMKDFDHNLSIPVDWVMGSAMIFRRAAYEQIGGFDERYFMYAEDSDLCRRLWEAGWAVYYVHDIHLRHTHGRASAKVPGVFRALIKNPFTRVHIYSWLKYFFKWRNNRHYYPHDI
ncbi:MAG: glycosyltransferase family 2 protein [Candidatus Magasanikbacteria bacterium]|nr:glycosyltransferase family 2 protein [Candidatus Magasanikbacteria bacterium]